MNRRSERRGRKREGDGANTGTVFLIPSKLDQMRREVNLDWRKGIPDGGG